jgi:hypothetical protein
MLRNCKGQAAQKGPTWNQGCCCLILSFEEIKALEKQLRPAKAENPKKRKSKSLLSNAINLTNSSDEMEEYFLFPPNIS